MDKYQIALELTLAAIDKRGLYDPSLTDEATGKAVANVYNAVLKSISSTSYSTPSVSVEF